MSCDLLEHLPSSQRYQAFSQMARVTQDHLVLVFPTGHAANQIFQLLAYSYRHFDIPPWLQEHLDYGLPDIQQITNWLLRFGWDAKITRFESARMHKVFLYFELRLGDKYFSYSLMRI